MTGSKCKPSSIHRLREVRRRLRGTQVLVSGRIWEQTLEKPRRKSKPTNEVSHFSRAVSISSNRYTQLGWDEHTWSKCCFSYKISTTLLYVYISSLSSRTDIRNLKCRKWISKRFNEWNSNKTTNVIVSYKQPSAQIDRHTLIYIKICSRYSLIIILLTIP